MVFIVTAVGAVLGDLPAVVIFVLALVASTAAMATIHFLLAFWDRRKGKDVDESDLKEDLREWLEGRIVEIEGWRVGLDEIAASPSLDIDRVQEIEELFWENLGPEAARKFQTAGWSSHWKRTSEGFRGPSVCATKVDVEKFSQFLAWVAARLRDIKAELSAGPKRPAEDRPPAC